MGTEKRERQKANRAMRREEELRLSRRSAVRRNILRWVAILVVAFGAVILIAWIGGAFSDDDPTPTPVITLPSETLPTPTSATDPVSTSAPTTAAP